MNAKPFPWVRASTISLAVALLGVLPIWWDFNHAGPRESTPADAAAAFGFLFVGAMFLGYLGWRGYHDAEAEPERHLGGAVTSPRDASAT